MHANSWSIAPLRPSALVAMLAVGVLACSGPTAESTADEGTLARFDGRSISAERLNETILGFPAEARPKDPAAREAWYSQLVRQLAVHDLLVEQARREGLPTEPETAVRVRETHKQILVTVFLRREISVTAPTSEEVEEFYEKNRASFSRPERREVFHIFLRPEPEESRAALEARLRSLRDRNLAGEPFALLAREHSQSQLRHDDGALGWIAPGQLAPRLNDIVFGLEEGVPSEVLLTDSGAHLFLASTVVAARAASLDEARPEVRGAIHQERQNSAVAEYLETQERDPADLAPTAEEFGALVTGGDRGALVQRVGEWTLTAGELFEQFVATRSKGQRSRDQAAVYAFLQSVVNGERLFQMALASGLGKESAVEKAMTAAEDDILAVEMQRRRLLERLAAEPEPVRAFFDEQSRRFAGPLRLRVARLSLPIGSESGQTMKQLEDAIPRLASGAESLEALAERIGGTVHAPEWQTLTDLQAQGGRLRGRLAGVPVGGFSEPVSTGREIELFHVLERSEPEIPDYESVRDAVHAAYLQVHGEELLASFVDDELARSGFELVPGGLTGFAERATGLVSTPADEG